jgi:hypothetical protein
MKFFSLGVEETCSVSMMAHKIQELKYVRTREIQVEHGKKKINSLQKENETSVW